MKNLHADAMDFAELDPHPESYLRGWKAAMDSLNRKAQEPVPICREMNAWTFDFGEKTLTVIALTQDEARRKAQIYHERMLELR